MAYTAEECRANLRMAPDQRVMRLAAKATLLRNIKRMVDRRDGMPAGVFAELVE
jgi:hypothetical protein